MLNGNPNQTKLSTQNFNINYIYTSDCAKNAHVESEKERHEDFIVLSIIASTLKSQCTKIPELTVAKEPDDGCGQNLAEPALDCTKFSPGIRS